MFSLFCSCHLDSFRLDYGSIQQEQERAMSDRLSTREAAKVVQVKQNLLELWRSKNVGPPYWKIMGAVRYDRAELMKWLQTTQRHVVPTPTLPPPSARRRKVAASRRSGNADAHVTA